MPKALIMSYWEKGLVQKDKLDKRTSAMLSERTKGRGCLTALSMFLRPLGFMSSP